jgi:hypothetical protein
MSRWLFGLALMGALALVASGPVSGSTASRSHAAAAWTAVLHAPGHHPKARKRWPISIVVRTAGGRGLSGTVQYHFIFNGTVVGTRSCLDVGNAPCRFSRGIYRDVLHFPRRSVGVPLTFQCVVKTRLGTKNINYAIKVIR